MSKSKPVFSERLDVPEDPVAKQEVEALLLYLKETRGFDFTAYKRASLTRRILVRMQTVGIRTFAEYQDHLQVDPDEFTRLFNTILINVTGFFRDPEAWECLGSRVIPTLIGAAASRGQVRVWSAGCASGEEAYTIAIMLAEAIGVERFRDRVKIYGTDVDEEALAQARQAVYSPRAVEDVPPELLRKYFDHHNDHYIFNKELRRSVIFGRHDLLKDAPISRVNLLICRNALMYFNAEAQALLMARFHFALADGGVLFLGKAETLLNHTANFGTVDVKRRLFTKAGRTEAHKRKADTDAARGAAVGDGVQELREAAADIAPVAQLLVDVSGKVLDINGQLRSTFGLSSRDVGRPLPDLEVAYKPFELRSSIDRAYAERRPVAQTDGSWSGPAGQTMHFDLLVVPIPDKAGGFLGCSIIFTDVTRAHRLHEEVQHTHQELETALEELQSTNEELETTNEELQSTVEELETTNEELQSTNEELETMNEELQSTNEELQTVNDEARVRSGQVNTANSMLESILGSLRSGVVMLDRNLQIHKWNDRAEDMWGLRSDEVLRKNFLNLDIGLPVEQLRAPIRACLTQHAEYRDLELDATNRRGKAMRVKVACTPLRGSGGADPDGVILLMEETDGRSRNDS